MNHRWMVVWTALTLAALAGASGAAAAEQDHVRITAQGWYPKLTGEGEYAASPFELSSSQLDAENSDWHYGLDFAARLGKHRILVNYSDGGHEGDGTGVSVDLTRGHALYGYSFVNVKYFDFGVVGGVDTYDLTTKVRQNDLSLSATDLAAGVDLGVRLPVIPLSIRGQALVALVDLSGDDTTLTDAEVTLDFHVTVLDLQIGYRYYDLKSENEDDRNKEDYRFQGPFAGIGFRF